MQRKFAWRKITFNFVYEELFEFIKNDCETDMVLLIVGATDDKQCKILNVNHIM
jgi:phosphoribosyl-AMP cyclohydrolase